jgi:hypothetical protein
MKKLVFSSLALGTLAGAIAGAAVSCPTAARAAEPMRLAEAEMDGITAGAALGLITAGAVMGSTSATVTATQSQHGSTLWGGGAEITGYGLVLGTANGSPTSGGVIAGADASGDINQAGSIGGVVNVSQPTSSTPNLGKTVVYGATWGVALDIPRAAK